MTSQRTTKKRSFSEQVRQAIEASGLSRYEISKATGVDQAALSRFIHGKRGLTTAALDKLGELLDLEIVMHGPKRS